MRAARTLLIAFAATFAITAIGAPSAGANAFFVTCASSHVANDDPIVFPGQAGRAHRHEFFGATNANANSTTQSLETSPTSCRLARDTAAYWAPTLEVRGILLTGTMHAYYQRAGKRSAQAPPHGLRIIAGDMRAAAAQPRTVVAWQCVGAGRTAQFTSIPACVRGERLGAWVKFPDCWNGRDLDSTDHRSHLAYAVRSTCPATHPVELMRVALLITWPVRPADPTTVTLGGGMMTPLGMHADFWNSWHQPTLRQLRWDCIEVARACGEIVRPSPSRM